MTVLPSTPSADLYLQVAPGQQPAQDKGGHNFVVFDSYC
jgi:hypothetical protein